MRLQGVTKRMATYILKSHILYSPGVFAPGLCNFSLFYIKTNLSSPHGSGLKSSKSSKSSKSPKSPNSRKSPKSPEANPMDNSAYLDHSGDEDLLEKLFIYQAFNQKTTRVIENIDGDYCFIF